MALVLGLKEGESFYLDDTKVDLEQISSPTRATLMIHGAIIRKMTIGPNHRTELLPGVYAQIGLDSKIDLLKIALEAPRNITILRKHLYDAKD